jgi:hypothetical protein
VIPERHARVANVLGTGGPEAPEALQQRVRRTVERSAPAVRPRPVLRVLAPALAAAAVAALVVGLAVGAGGGPSVTALAAVSERPATGPAPEGDGALLAREFEGVAFPDWGREFGWHANGTRSDTIDGRRADTVFYTHEGHTIGYTVLAGEPIDPPESAATVTRDGVELHRFRDGHRDVVMFERNGRTCMLAGHVIHDDTLPKLASWQADGSVRF